MRAEVGPSGPPQIPAAKHTPTVCAHLRGESAPVRRGSELVRLRGDAARWEGGGGGGGGGCATALPSGLRHNALKHSMTANLPQGRALTAAARP